MKVVTTRMVLTALLGAAVILTTGSSMRASKTDTVDDVMRAGMTAKPILNSIQAALRDSQAIAARMEDRAFATQVFELAKKDDKKGLADLFKGIAPSSEITIQEIRDWTIRFFVHDSDHGYELCIGDDCKHPSGAKSPVVFKQLF